MFPPLVVSAIPKMHTTIKTLNEYILKELKNVKEDILKELKDVNTNLTTLVNKIIGLIPPSRKTMKTRKSEKQLPTSLRTSRT